MVSASSSRWSRLAANDELSGLGGSRGIIVLLVKQVHLQNDAGAREVLDGFFSFFHSFIRCFFAIGIDSRTVPYQML